MLATRLLAAALLVGATSSPHAGESSIGAAIAQANQSVDQAMESMTQARNAASALGKQAPQDAARAYVRIAHEIENADVGSLLSDAEKLRMKTIDMWIEAALRYARAGDRDGVLNALDSAIGRTQVDLGMALTMPEFEKWKNDPALLAIVARSKYPATMGRRSAIGSAFHDTLSDAEKVAGLSLFWAEVRRSFVHFDKVPTLNWDQTYLDILPKVLAAKTTAEYYTVMMQVAPLLHDGHTNIYPPEELRDEFYARPAIKTALVEGHVIVTDVRNRRLQEQVRTGDEIMRIDGQEVHAYAQSKIAPFVSSSTPQDRDLRTYGYQLLTGAKRQPVQLTLRNANGIERNVNLARGEEQDVPQKAFDFKILPGNIAYISLDHFESAAAVKAFEAALPAIMAAKGLVIDVRANGGGSTHYGLQILSYLSDAPIPVEQSLERHESAYLRAQADLLALRPLGTATPYSKQRDRHFSGPVAVLAGPRTFSAAEDFLVSFDSMKRGTIVGSATGGSTGMPLSLSLPGGGRARICVKYDLYPDGRSFVGKGVLPQVAIQETVADIRAGRDVVLERALATLK